MTKQQAVSTFMMEYADSIRQQENGRPDYPLRRQNWNDFVDMLQRVGDITSK